MPRSVMTAVISSRSVTSKAGLKTFASAGAIGQTQDERIMTIGLAAGGAIVIALVDYGIMRYKRSREQVEIRNLPEGTPIITRRPLYEEESGAEDAD